MILIIDTNRIIAALIKDSACRNILEKQYHHFLAPDFSLDEIKKYGAVICKKAGLSSSEFDLLLHLIFYNIEIVPKLDYEKFVDKAEQLIGERDAKDVPFLALAMAKKADGIWSDDKDFLVQSKIKIYKTKELV